MDDQKDVRSALAEQIGEKAADELLNKIIDMTKKGSSLIEIMETVQSALKGKAKPGAPQEVAVAAAAGEAAAVGAATAAGTYVGNK